MNKEIRREIVRDSLYFYNYFNYNKDMAMLFFKFSPIEEYIASNAIDMYSSLRKAIDEAGGTPNLFITENLDNVSILELIEHLCTNGIRFVYERED